MTFFRLASVLPPSIRASKLKKETGLRTITKTDGTVYDRIPCSHTGKKIKLYSVEVLFKSAAYRPKHVNQFVFNRITVSGIKNVYERAKVKSLFCTVETHDMSLNTRSVKHYTKWSLDRHIKRIRVKENRSSQRIQSSPKTCQVWHNPLVHRLVEKNNLASEYQSWANAWQRYTFQPPCKEQTSQCI